MALKRKGLAGCLQEMKSVDRLDADSWVERRNELMKDGKSVLEADRTVVIEIKEQIDKELNLLKEQLNIPLQSKEELDKSEAKERQKELDAINKTYEDELTAIEAEERSINTELQTLTPPKGRPQFIDASTGQDLGLRAIKNVTFTSAWTGQLLPQRTEDGVVKPAQIIVPWKFKDFEGKTLSMSNFIGENGKIDPTKFPPDLMRFIGYRIPTSKQSSMSFVEVVGFLPEEITDTVIAPRDLIAQMGLDFDYDKLYLHQFNIGLRPDGVVDKYQGEDRIKTAQNEILAVQQEVLSDPKAQDVIQDPIGYGRLQELSRELDQQDINNGTFNPLSQAYQRHKYINANQAKKGVGVFSLLTTLLATAQTIQVPVYFTQSVRGKESEVVISFGDQIGTRISAAKGKKGNPKSSVASAFQNVALDNEKLQIGDKLNMNDETYPVINALIASGFDEDTIIPFITQPIIKEYVREAMRAKGSMENLEVLPEQEAYNRVIERWESETYDEDTPEGRASSADAFGEKELKEVLKNKNPDIYGQRVLLDKFVRIKDMGKEMRKLSTAMDTDAQGIPKFFTTSVLKEQEIRTLDQVRIKNSEKFIGEFERSGGNILNITPETISGYASVHALFNNNQLWQHILPYKSVTVSEIYRRLEQYTGMGTRDHTQRGAWRFEVFKDLVTFIQSTNTNFATRERLFLDTKTNKSLATILRDIKDGDKISDNPLINVLNYNIDKRSDRVSTISFNNSGAANTIEEHIHAGFAELLADDSELFEDYKVSDFAKDLAQYGMIAGNHIASSFRRYIPIAYQKQALDKIVRDINFDNLETVDSSGFIIQHVQHNPWSVPSIDPNDFAPVKGKNLKDSIDITLMDTSKDRYYQKAGTEIALSGFLSYRHSDGYSLYALVDKAKGKYIQIPVLGRFGMDEYQPGVSLAKSVIASRNESTASTGAVIEAKDIYDGESQEAQINDTQDNPIADNTEILNRSEPLIETPTIGSMIDKIKTSSIPYYQFLAKKLSRMKFEGKTVKDFPITWQDEVVINGVKGLGMWSQKRKEFVMSRELSGHPKELTDQVFLHELIHMLSVEGLKNNEALKSDLRRLVNFVRPQLSKLNERFKKLYDDEISVEEFVAEILTDLNAQKQLAKLQLPDGFVGEKKYNNALEAFFDKLFTAIKDFLGIDIKANSILERALKDSMEAIELQQDMAKHIARNENNGADDLRQWTSDGLLFAADEGPRFDVIGEDRQIRIRQMQSTIAKIKDLPGSTKRVEELRERINQYQTDIEEAEKIDALEDLETFFDTDLETLRKIMAQPKIEIGDYYEAKRIMDLWMRSLDLFFTEEQQRFRTVMYDKFQGFKNKVEQYQAEMRGVENSLMESVLRKEGVDEKIGDIMARAKDIDWLHARTLDIGRYGNAMLDVIHKVLVDTGIDTRKEITDFEKELNQVLNDTKKELGKLGYKGTKLWDLFKQRRSNGKETGQLVTRLIPEFYDQRRTEWYAANEGTDSSYYKWLKDNTVVFDFRRLFRQEDVFEGEDVRYNKTNVTYQENSPDIQAHKDELINLLGQREFDRLMGRLERKLEDYKKRYDYNKQRVWSDFDNDQEREKQLSLWVQEYSPYWFGENVNNAKRVTTVKNRGYEYTYDIASKPEWYDSNFNQIIKNDTLLKFYEMYLDTLYDTKRLLPDHAVEHLGMNAVPYMSKSAGELFGEKGMQAGMDGVRDSLKRKISSPDNNPSFLNVDPVTEKEILTIPSNIPSDFDEVQKLIRIQEDEYEVEYGKSPTPEQKVKMRQDAYDAVARAKSFNLEQAIKTVFMVGTNYKHKAKIEDQIKLAHTIMENAEENKRNMDGKVLTDRKGRIQTKLFGEAFKNAKESMEFTMRTFYQIPQEQSGNLGKTFTTEEKKEKERLQSLITNADTALAENKISQEKHSEIVTNAKDQIDRLGRVVKGTKVFRQFMKYIQLKGMGWNWFSAFNNVGFGVMANYTTAADGRIYTTEELNEAYALTFHSILKNTSLNGVATPTAKKIRNLVNRFGLEDIVIDFMKSSRTKGTGFFKRLMPYQLQKHSEYLNYAPVMIAMLKHEGVWDSYDRDGNWIGEGKEPDVKAKIRRVVDKNHGNYDPDSSIQVDKNVFGQAAAQFRRWAFEAFANRFEKEKPDHLLGISQKGRYRSGIFMFTWAKEKGQENRWENLFQKNMFMMQQLGRKLLNRSTKLDERFDEVDAANLRANMREGLMFMSLLAIGIMLKHLATDEEDDKARFAFYTLMNAFGRIQMDLSFYVNPLEFERLMRRPIPVMSVITDTGEWVSAVYRYFNNDDIIQSGVSSGDSRLWRETRQMLPFWTQWQRTMSAGKIIYK